MRIFSFCLAEISLRDLPTWRLCADLVAEVTKIGVMCRPGDPFDMPALEAKIPGLTEESHFLLMRPLQNIFK